MSLGLPNLTLSSSQKALVLLSAVPEELWRLSLKDDTEGGITECLQQSG